MTYHNKKILVTGGAGFIGSNLCEALVENNVVYSLDNYFTGSVENHKEKVIYVSGDAKDCFSIFSDQYFDLIFHFGEYSRVEQSFEDSFTVLELNSAMSEILKLAKKHGSKLIYSCSSTVFNDDDSILSLSPYTLSKKLNIQLMKNFCTWEKIPYSIVYFYNAYGRGEIESGNYATVVAKFLRLKKRGLEKAPVTLPGTQRRNFTHIDDIVSGILLAAEKGMNEDYGIGSDTSFSILELCALLEMEPEYEPEREGNRNMSPLLNQKIKELGWCESMSLPEYIRHQLIDLKSK